jgi:hypothetical protein
VKFAVERGLLIFAMKNNQMRFNMTQGFAKTGLFIAAILMLAGSPALAGCLNPALSPEQVGQFKSDPQGLIRGDSADARTVEALTRDLAGTDASLATDLVHVAETAKPLFQTAIAAGLAQAAVACSTTDPQAAQLIQQVVAAFENGQFQASFAAVAGDLSTAAAAGAASSAVGAVGSVAIINPNPSTGSNTLDLQNAHVASFSNTVFNFTTPTLSTAADPVSPSR